MKIKRRRRQYKYFVIPILLIGLPTIIFFVFNQSLLKNKSLISPVPIVLSINARKILFSNIPDSNLEDLLRKSGINYSLISSSSDLSYLVKLETGEEVIFSSKKDLNSQVASLQLILSRLKIEGRSFKRLDLRFDQPVIIFK